MNAAYSLSIGTTDSDLTPEAIDFYRQHGFVRVRGIISREEADSYRQAALAFAQENKTGDHRIFQQLVNVWREDDAMKSLTLHPNVATTAERLAGIPLRLWHDQILIKEPHKSAATEFHQDQPYWPHTGSTHPISCWIALCDVPVERGCMSFIPGSHRRTELQSLDLTDPKALFVACPDLQWDERITMPLRAGDCTFHHGRCAHMATPNITDEPRVAHVVIFMDESTLYQPRGDGQAHPVTDPLGLAVGAPLEGGLFPSVREF